MSWQTFRASASSRSRSPGLSYARNTGILQATGDIIVAIDDDVVAPPHGSTGSSRRSHGPT